MPMILTVVCTADSLHSQSVQAMNWTKITKAKALIDAGFYDDPFVLDAILEHRSMDALLVDLNRCPVGEGNKYRDIVAEVLIKSLSYVIDVPLVRKELTIEGGRADLELPIKTEHLNGYYLWQDWCRRYDVRSVIVEVKNMANPCSVACVQQIKGYLNDGPFGRIGLLVSRHAFSSNASENLRACARDRRCLILPFSHNDLIQFANASSKGTLHSMGFLRRVETRLVQSVA